MAERQASPFTPTTEPPNGRVTQGQLYKALHDMDVAYTERFNVILGAINDRSDVDAQLRRDFEDHRTDHPGEKMSSRYGKMTPLITGISVAVAAAVTTVKEFLFG